MKIFITSFYLILFISNVHKINAQELNDELWERDDIPVCWINPTNENAIEREWVKRAIKKTWEAYSKLEFNGWCKCNEFKEDGNNGIRIKISNEHAHTKSIGRAIAFDSVGMILNFIFDDGIFLPISDRYTDLSKNGSNLVVERIFPKKEHDRKVFIEAQAVHEFGHAIGFSHEQARNDCNFGSDCDFKENVPPIKTILYVPCNERSVMNYCNDIYLNEGFLSIHDRKLLDIHYKKNINIKDSIRIEYNKKNFFISFKGKNSQMQRQASPKKVKYLADKILIKISGDESVMNQITQVEYFFHRNTFKPMLIKNSRGGYPVVLKKIWGNFSCEARVYFKNYQPIIISNYIVASNRVRKKYGFSSDNKNTVTKDIQEN